ncbi:MAG: hypothetical protein HIU88_03490, partial [Acidobacteria bacterium]|nr:hypothetical protein [Acidobacteriota bacterium]
MTEKPKAEHPAVFASASVHFTLSTNTKKPLDIYKASRRLLAADVASSAAWPDSQKVYVPARYRARGKELYRLRSLPSDFRALRAAPAWGKAISFAVRHRHDLGLARMGLQMVWAQKLKADIERVKKNPIPGRDLLWFSARHPIVFVRFILPTLRLSRTRPSDDAEQASSRAGATEPADGPPSGSVEEPDVFAALDDTTDLLDQAERLYIDQQVVSAAERVVDEGLFGGRDRDESRFVRLLLRQSYHELIVPDRSETQRVVFEPRLFLHESGAVQLTVRVSTDGPLSTIQVVRLMHGTSIFKSSRIPRPLVQGTGWETVATWSGEMDAEAELADFQHPQPMSMLELLHFHLRAVGIAIGTHLPQNWINYPTGILEAGNCCPPGAWRHVHEKDVKKVMLRFDSDAAVAAHVKIGRDLSSMAEHSLFTNLATTVYFQWEGERPSGIPELDTTLVVEYALYLYWRL